MRSVLWKNPYFKLLVKYGLGLALLAWVVWSFWDKRQPDGQQVGISAVLERPVHWPMLAFGLALYAVAVLVTIARWYGLVRAQDLPFTPRDAIRLGLVGFYFNTFLPGSVGGDIIKAAFIARQQDRRALAVATVLLDRVIGLTGLFWLATLLGGALFLSGSFDDLLAIQRTRLTLQTILLGAAAITAGTLAAWILLGWIPSAWLDRFELRLRGFPKIGPTLGELVHAVRVYRRKGRAVALALAMSIANQFILVVAFFCAANFFTPTDQLPPFGTHLLIVPIGMTFQAGVPLPGGIGGAEFGYGTLYDLIGFRFADGVLGSLGLRIISWVLGLVGYVVYLRSSPSERT